VATKKERQRKLARERYERRIRRQAAKNRQARKLGLSSLAALAVAGVVVGGLFLGGVLGSSPKSSAATNPIVHCTYTKAAAPAIKGERKVALPPAKASDKTTYQATIDTNRGDIVLDLDNSQATCTVNSFVSLADQAYFNQTHCHRLTLKASGLYVLQCGDPTGTGKGTPGYEFANENLPAPDSSGDATYAAGTVAMANSGGSDSNGSQFFLVYKNSPLPPDYTRFGTIVSGLNIIQNVAKAGVVHPSSAGDGHPKDKVQIISVKIKKT
jgi:peptidyl-prolyl cis-trans isomerase B (cyclophilin B)